MRRTLIQLDEATYQALRQRAFRQERSLSALVRELLQRELHEGGRKPRQTRARTFASVAAGRSRQGTLAPVSEHHDAALAKAFES